MIIHINHILKLKNMIRVIFRVITQELHNVTLEGPGALLQLGGIAFRSTKPNGFGFVALLLR